MSDIVSARSVRRKPYPSQDECKILFDYDPEKGVLTWRAGAHRSKRFNRRYAGKEVGSIHPSGYRVTALNCSQFPVQNLIWIWMYGPIPDDMIVDHADGARANNRLTNFGLVTAQGNQRNQKRFSTNTSGVCGVMASRRKKNPWRAVCYVGGRRRNLGSYPDIESAAAAARAFRRDNGFSERHGS